MLALGLVLVSAARSAAIDTTSDLALNHDRPAGEMLAISSGSHRT